jgi:hypothetical protein
MDVALRVHAHDSRESKTDVSLIENVERRMPNLIEA